MERNEATSMTEAELQSLRNLGNEAEAAADEIERLRAELRRLSADARRYAWLKSKAHETTAWDRYEGSHWAIGIYDHKSRGLDAAIDQAMDGK